MLARMRFGQYSKLLLTSCCSSLSLAFTIRFISCQGSASCSMTCRINSFSLPVLIQCMRDLWRLFSLRQGLIMSKMAFELGFNLVRLNSMLSKAALICIPKVLTALLISSSVHFCPKWCLKDTSIVSLMMEIDCSIGLGIQKANIVRKGRSRVYSLRMKFTPQKRKLKRKGNSRWQAEQKAGMNQSLKDISSMLSMNTYRVSTLFITSSLSRINCFISLIHESRFNGAPSRLQASPPSLARNLLSSTLKSCRKFVFLPTSVQFIYMQGFPESLNSECTRQVLPEAFWPQIRNVELALSSRISTQRLGSIAPFQISKLHQ